MGMKLSGKILYCFLAMAFFALLPFRVEAAECVTNDVNGDFISDVYDAADEFCVLTATEDNKKGLQGTEYVVPKTVEANGITYVQNADEAPLELGINHVLLNFDIAKMLASDSQTENVIVYNYNGIDYRFDKNYLFPYLYRARQYETMSAEVTDRKVALTMVLLLSKPTDPKYNYLLCPDALNSTDGGLHMFYAPNTADPVACETLSAVYDYLTKAFGDREHFIQNWILGNEVDMPDVYHYSGSYDASYNACLSAQAFNLFYEKIKDNSPYSRGYISITNRWNTTSGGKGIGGRNFLTLFSSMVQTDNWNLAFHAYDPTWTYKLWEKETADCVSYSVDSPYICAANLSYMTDYIKNTFAGDHRIILSEQGFNVQEESSDEQYKQAAELVYTYYVAARNSMVDAVIFNNWYDCSYQADLQGIHIGLHDDAGNKREAYYAFKYMDTDPTQIEKYQAYLNQYCVTFPSWDCNILYTEQPEISVVNPGAQTLFVQSVLPWNGLYSNDIYYRWSVEDEQTMEKQVIQDWASNGSLMIWTPQKNGVYTIICEMITTDHRLYRAESIYAYQAAEESVLQQQ